LTGRGITLSAQANEVSAEDWGYPVNVMGQTAPKRQAAMYARAEIPQELEALKNPHLAGSLFGFSVRLLTGVGLRKNRFFDSPQRRSG